MTSEPIGEGADGHDHYELAGTVVEAVDRHHDGGPKEGWLVPHWLTQIDVVYLTSQDQARASHS